MPNLLAMSFEGELAPSFDLLCLRPGGRLPDGWGLGYYPGGEPSAAVLKEPAPPQGSIRSTLVSAWEHLESSLFLVHIRAARWGSISDANTQPFVRSWGRRDWMLAHSGSLEQRLELGPKAMFEPVGSTDTELIFCELMSRIAAQGWRSLMDVHLPTLHGWLDVLADQGVVNIALTDGRDLCVYADRDSGDGEIYIGQLTPPYERVTFGDADLTVDLTRRGVKSRKGIVVASAALEATGDDAVEIPWRRLPHGHLLLIRQGAVVAELAPPARGAHAATSMAAVSAPFVIPGRDLTRPQIAAVKRFEVTHETSYRYARPVERSSHQLRLQPCHDRLQSLLSFELDISVPGQQRDYEDVFGNRVRRLHIDTPYSEMRIRTRSIVEVLDVDPLDFRPLRARSSIPLVWMPWQRHMLQPYLLPPELPESELHELIEYAMSFVKRNDYDLLDTLLDINTTIYREYQYRQGATNVFTTPFEVYANRRGVCQDFTNLFICLARLLGVPARYVCGYIYTGPKNTNHVQSEASHAWVQLYLPEVGWKGFDPTNGILTQTDHVRVAVGRHYTDATPTSGTIYVGGGPETLEVAVRVEPVAQDT